MAISTGYRILLVGGLIALSSAVYARPASYVPDDQWTEKAWKCKEAGKSLIEIESRRLPTETLTKLKVADLRIGNRSIQSSSVKGLDSFVGSLDAVQTLSSGCGWTGEFVFIRGYVRGRTDPTATEQQEFFVPYAR
jgi:hypothetical protein